jgi:hypothetical protein
LTSHSRKLGSGFEGPGRTDNRFEAIANGAGSMRDHEPNKRIQALTPNKKQTATMKRRALKLKAMVIRFGSILLQKSKIERPRKCNVAKRHHAATLVRDRFSEERSLTSPRATRVSVPENFRSPPQKDFCNKIGQLQTFAQFSCDAAI